MADADFTKDSVSNGAERTDSNGNGHDDATKEGEIWVPKRIETVNIK